MTVALTAHFLSTSNHIHSMKSNNYNICISFLDYHNHTSLKSYPQFLHFLSIPKYFLHLGQFIYSVLSRSLLKEVFQPTAVFYVRVCFLLIDSLLFPLSYRYILLDPILSIRMCPSMFWFVCCVIVVW